MKNRKVKYKSLSKVNLKEKVLDENNESYVFLDAVIINVMINENDLFLTAEQEARIFKNNVTVVLNLKAKEK